MKKPTEGKTALISFLEAVEVDKLAHPKADNAKKLGGYMSSKKKDPQDIESIKQERKPLPGQKHPLDQIMDNEEVKDEPREMDEAAFSRQHYQAIAKILKDTVENADYDEERQVLQSYMTDIAERLSTLFKADNPNFDDKKFKSAVGVR